jgi:hypothetical protein
VPPKTKTKTNWLCGKLKMDIINSKVTITKARQQRRSFKQCSTQKKTEKEANQVKSINSNIID